MTVTVPGDCSATSSMLREHAGERDRAHLLEHQEDGQRQADVTDPVHDERLLGGGGRGRSVRPEPDQQVGRQADALPAGVQGDERVAQHQQQHRRDEQVQVREELAPVGVVRHVADRVDVDQRADTGDQQHEGQRQRVDEQPEVDVQRPDWIQVNTVHRVHPVVRRLAERRAKKTTTPSTNAAITVAQPMRWPIRSSSRPPTSSTIAPASGRAMSSTRGPVADPSLHQFLRLNPCI